MNTQIASIVLIYFILLSAHGWPRVVEKIIRVKALRCVSARTDNSRQFTSRRGGNSCWKLWNVAKPRTVKWRNSDRNIF